MKSIIALTHDYGWRLWYWGYLPVDLWPYQADFALHLARGGNLGLGIQPLFNQLTEGKDYFLVTHFGELNAQAELKTLLHDNYPIIQSGDGYILFDLSSDQGTQGSFEQVSP